jgi:S-phase kinase-associated protein 1
MEEIKSDIVYLKSQEGVLVSLTREEASHSKTLHEILAKNDSDSDDSDDSEDSEESDEDEQLIPLRNIRHLILAKIVEFMKYHLHNPMKDLIKPVPFDFSKCGVDEWDVAFMKSLTFYQLKDMIAASNFLDLPDLQGLCEKYLTWLTYGKTPEALRHLFGLVDSSRDEYAIQTFREMIEKGRITNYCLRSQESIKKTKVETPVVPTTATNSTTSTPSTPIVIEDTDSQTESQEEEEENDHHDDVASRQDSDEPEEMDDGDASGQDM